MFLTSYSFRWAHPPKLGAGHVNIPYERAVGHWNVTPGSQILCGMLVLCAEGKPLSSAVAAAINVVAVAHCMRPVVELSWRAFSMVRLWSSLQIMRDAIASGASAAAVGPTMPEADVQHIVPPALRLDLLALPALHAAFESNGVRHSHACTVPCLHTGLYGRKLRDHCTLRLVASSIGR